MSKPAVFEDIRVTQRKRFYYWICGSRPKNKKRQVVNNPSNTHIIPANANTARTLKKVREGDAIELRGYLVNERAADGWRWKSSLVRTNSGNSACELFLVEHISIGSAHLISNPSVT